MEHEVGSVQFPRQDSQDSVNASVVTRNDSSRWLSDLRVRIRVCDVFAILFAICFAYLFKFNLEKDQYLVIGSLNISYLLVAELIALVWICSISIFNLDDPKFLGYGLEEYKNIVSSTITVFGVIAIVAVLGKVDFARVFVSLALPIGLCLMILNHWLWRKYLHRKRSKDQCMTNVVLVGFEQDILDAFYRFKKSRELGYKVQAAFLINKKSVGNEMLYGVPVLGSERDVTPWLLEQEKIGNKINTVIVTSQVPGTTDYIKELAWDLEQIDSTSSLVVSSQLIGFSGSRTTLRQIEGLPLVHLDLPDFGGSKAFTKRVMDILGAIIGLIITLPITIPVALAIKKEDGGPALFNQKRMGKDGKPYVIHKFRSMRMDADKIMAEALKNNPNARHEMKSEDDPRVTKIGKFIRKYSIDEIPQFLNVLKGDMSLVGPRPLAIDEVDLDKNYMHRRLYVKPGITGLWQISGRSETSWDDRVDMDFQYVESWSPVGDIFIMLKTLKVVASGKGAY